RYLRKPKIEEYNRQCAEGEHPSGAVPTAPPASPKQPKPRATPRTVAKKTAPTAPVEPAPVKKTAPTAPSRRGGRREPPGGAPKGNSNAATHGIYSRFFSDEDLAIWDQAAEIDHLDYELRVARMQLARAIKKQKEYDQIRKDCGDENKDAFLSLPVTEFNREVGSEGGKEETKRSIPDVDNVIDRLLGRVAQLMKQKDDLLQSPLLSKADQQAHTQTVITQLNSGDLTAIEAGLQLEALLIPLPVTLAAMVKVELATEAEESFEGGGVSADDIARKAAEIRERKRQEREEFLKRREKELEALNEDMGM
ncbi:hypothetical protein, partial [Endozoicomonas sp. NE40]